MGSLGHSVYIFLIKIRQMCDNSYLYVYTCTLMYTCTLIMNIVLVLSLTYFFFHQIFRFI